MTGKKKSSNLVLSWFSGLAKAGVLGIFISSGVFVVNQWVDIRTEQVALAASNAQNKESIDHNYNEMINYLTDIKQTVHDINDRMNRDR